MSEGLQELLAWTGMLLVLLGLLGGFAIPVLRSPRIGLSAHTAAIQSGLLLIGLAVVGGRLTLPDGWAAAIAHTAAKVVMPPTRVAPPYARMASLTLRPVSEVHTQK